MLFNVQLFPEGVTRYLIFSYYMYMYFEMQDNLENFSLGGILSDRWHEMNANQLATHTYMIVYMVVFIHQRVHANMCIMIIKSNLISVI